MEELIMAIKEAMEQKYGKLNDYGGYTRIGEDAEESWLSTQRVFDLVCDVINDNDYLFREEE